MNASRTLRYWALGAVLVACGDGGKRPVGASCDDAAECESGLCWAGQCLDPNGDDDGDGVVNGVELALATDPLDPDSDGDGAGDGAEVGADPRVPPDSDGDGKKDALESATLDGDGDCVADQFDAEEKDVRHEHALEVCERVGLCATHVDSLLATCEVAGGAPVWHCDPSEVPGWGASDVTCDGVDEDCDGETDEDYLPTVVACPVGACTATGNTLCAAGVVGDTCVTEAAGDDVSCDGVDDDCDGATDDDFAAVASRCGVGACASEGTVRCVAGGLEDDCEPGTAAADDATCDGADDDCDGATDEDYGEARVVACGEGACRADGVATCVEGLEEVACEPLDAATTDDASCDGIDNDCDGETDEDFARAATGCGVGACAAVGEAACVDGAIVDSCRPGMAAASDTSCDGVDDDCNGVADEDYPVALTACGVGACAASGRRTCVGGAPVDSCMPGEPAASDTTCDGVDDDCSGKADEDFVPYESTCGVGVCAATGVVTCADGAAVDDCAAEPPDATVDAECDGRDVDCDGATDEDYVASPTSCGVGACAGSGVTTCVGGQLGDTCEAGSGAARDEDCDGVDDDCDEATDEDYVAPVTHCGIGGCARDGVLACAGGATEDTCVAGTPAANDATCDGVDDDCDELTDEDYAIVGTTCGQGVCESHGQFACVAGEEVDSCEPLAPDCGGRECGDDGCGGSCGSCGAPPAACVTVGCGRDGQCQETIDGRYCYIGGACIASGVKNPDNDCQACDATSDQTGWSPLKRGSVCADDGNTCTAEECDGQGTCAHPGLPNLTACNDGDGATIGDWCLATTCGGFYNKVEAKVSPADVTVYFEHYRRGGAGASSPSAAGVFYYIGPSNQEPRAGVVGYTTSSTAITPMVSTNTTTSTLLALDSSRVVVGDRMWEYVGSKWTNARDANTIREVWGSDGDEFPPAFERLIRYSSGTGIGLKSYALGAGRTAGDGGLTVRSCSASVFVAGPWTCGYQNVATGDYNNYPAQVVRAAGTNYIFTNTGSRTSPTAWKVLKYTNSQWSADASLTRQASTELRDVTYAGGWFIGVGPSDTLWVSKLAGWFDIDVPNATTGYSWLQAVSWNGNVVVLGTSGLTSTTVVLAWAPLDDYLSDSTRWKVHTLWSGQSLIGSTLVAPNDNELYVLGGDKLGSTLTAPTVRAVWRFTAAHTPL